MHAWLVNRDDPSGVARAYSVSFDAAAEVRTDQQKCGNHGKDGG